MTAPDCPTPQTCPVPDPADVDLRRLRLAHLETGRRLSRVHPDHLTADALDKRDESNSRFAALAGRAHTYAGDTRTVTLLETAFHNVHESLPRVIYAATDLAGRALSDVTVHERVPLVDLRDEQLVRLGLTRDQIVTTTAAHYPCTRQWAGHLLDRRIGGVAPVGLVWHSRVAELARDDSPLLDDLLADRAAEAIALYDVMAFAAPDDPLYETLVEGQGRLLVDEIAERLDAEID